MDSKYIRARDLALRWGMLPETKGGRKTNHTQFLDRTAEKHPADIFPVAHRLGGRIVYEIEEVLRFERSLPIKSKQKQLLRGVVKTQDAAV